MASQVASAILLMAFSVGLQAAVPHQEAEPSPSAIRMELTAEVAATDDRGLPSAMRITLKNVGTVALDTPVLTSSCSPDGRASFQFTWTSSDNKTGMRATGDCGARDSPSLPDRVRQSWVRLQPGEFLITTENLRGLFEGLKPGSIKYWVEYTPPEATTDEAVELEREGYSIPTKHLETIRKTITVR